MRRTTYNGSDTAEEAHRGVNFNNHNSSPCAAMDKLKPGELVLTGNWIKDHGCMRGDAVCQRIEWLIAHHLTKIASSPQSGGWGTLYRDPEDG